MSSPHPPTSSQGKCPLCPLRLHSTRDNLQHSTPVPGFSLFREMAESLLLSKDKGGISPFYLEGLFGNCRCSYTGMWYSTTTLSVHCVHPVQAVAPYDICPPCPLRNTWSHPFTRPHCPPWLARFTCPPCPLKHVRSHPLTQSTPSTEVYTVDSVHPVHRNTSSCTPHTLLSLMSPLSTAVPPNRGQPQQLYRCPQGCPPPSPLTCPCPCPRFFRGQGNDYFPST